MKLKNGLVKPANRVAGGISPPAPTPPCKRVRTGRFPKSFQNKLAGLLQFIPVLATVLSTPIILNPVGHEVTELHRLLTAFQVQAFTLSQPLRWAFGYYAVCWLLLNHSISCLIKRYRFPSGSLFPGDEAEKPRHLYTRASLVISRSHLKQISPDKSMNFLCATASFTVAVRSLGFVVWCQLAFSLRLIWYSCSSARKFASGFLQTIPRGKALAIC